MLCPRDYPCVVRQENDSRAHYPPYDLGNRVSVHVRFAVQSTQTMGLSKQCLFLPGKSISGDGNGVFLTGVIADHLVEIFWGVEYHP